MEESHQRNIIDHLELGGTGGGHHQEDLSKGVLRTIQHVENGTLHFITIPPAGGGGGGSSREQQQEYRSTDFSLLGTDLLSGHLPNGLLVDYIGGGGGSGQFHQQGGLLDHHGGGIQTYTAEDLQNLVEASSLQTSESERKLFLQFVNKPPAHEAPVIVTNPKDQMTLGSLGDHDKLGDSGQFLHYHHQDQLLGSTHVGSMDHGHIQQQQSQSHLSSIHSMLQGDCSPSKLFHVTSSSSSSTNIAINPVTSQNCIQIPPLTPIKRIESPKRYLGYQMVQNQQPQPQQQLSDDNFLSREDLMECEVRSDEDEDIAASHFANTYLPHKKRLKKLGDAPKGATQADQFHRDSVIATDHHHHKPNQPEPAATAVATPQKKAFACQLCSDSFDDQLQFFNHLKTHYEPSISSPTDDAKSGGGSGGDPKKKPKLPRVKHTKKLKNDKSSQQPTATHQPPQPAQVVDQGEFSETEDMLEGIRTAVQKVQETVEDTNDGTIGRPSANANGAGLEKSWYQLQQQQQQVQHPAAPPPIDFNGDLDTQEIHINAGSDNFVLFLNKADFSEQDILDHPDGGHPSQHQSQHHQQPHHQQQHHSILTSADHHLQPTGSSTNPQPSSHVAPPSYILGGTTPPATGTATNQQPGIGDPCGDIQNIQILGFGSSEIDFNQLSELSGTKLLKDEQRSIEGDSDGGLDGSQEDEDFYLTDAEEAVGMEEGEGQLVEEHDEVVPEVPAVEKKRGRKKAIEEIVVNPEEGETVVGKKPPGKKFLCSEPDCDKLFNSKTAVRYHELQHKNLRPFCCALCPKNFFTSSALKVHERLHSGEKPYKCEECGRAFRQWGDMKYHQSSIHSTEKTQICEFCGKKFARRYSLVLHRKIHLNEKNHVCDICNKAFRASSYLQSHRMIHTGQKPFSCPQCGKKFRCGGDMKRHLKTHDRKAQTADSAPKSTTTSSSSSSSRPTTKKSPTDVIDLTKIKSENQAKIIQAPPVVTVLAKPDHAAAMTDGKADSTGQLVYLTTAPDQFRKAPPNESSVLMDMGRW